MPFRGGPRTVDEHIADIEEQLRKLDRRPRTVTITTTPAPSPHPSGAGHTHDDPAFEESTVVGGVAEAVTPAKTRAGKYGVGVGDWSKAAWDAVAIGWQAFAGDPDTSTYGSIALGYTVLSEGDESVVIGYGAIEYGASSQSSFNVLIGAESVLGNETYGSYDSIVIGPVNRVHAQHSIVLGDQAVMGDPADDDTVGYDNIFIAPESPSFTYPMRGSDHCVMIGTESGMVLPSFGDTSALPYYPSGVVMMQGYTANQVWGEDIVAISSGGNFRAQAWAWGTGLIVIGPNAAERYSGYFAAWENITDSAAFGFNNWVAGDNSIILGTDATTYRMMDLLLHEQNAGAITLANVVEIGCGLVLPNAGIVHSGNLGSLSGSLCPVYCNMPGPYGPAGGTVTFILDDVDTSSDVYSPGTHPNGNDYLTGASIGTWLIIKKADASANTVTITPASGTIDGLASVVLTDQWDWLEVMAMQVKDGAGGAVVVWTIISGVVGGTVYGGAPTILQSPPFQKTGTLTAIVTGTSPWYPETDGVIESVRAAVGTGPSAGNVICDVHKNGVTVFTTQANRPSIGVGSVTDVSVTPDDPDFIGGTDYFTVDIDDPGTDAADLVVTIRYRAA